MRLRQASGARVRATAIILFLAATSSVSAQTVTPGRPPGGPPNAPPVAKGTAVIKGKITAADTGRPLRRAQIIAFAPEAGDRRSTSTNLRGEYEIRDLAKGRYTITATRSGYLSWQHGMKRPGEPSRPLDVEDGAKLESIDFALPRAGVISGRVVDENSEAVAGASLYAMRREFFRGTRRLVPINSAVSDDTGQYRIIGLTPGTYLVMAQLRDTWTVPGPPKRILGYAPTFHPAAANAGDAQPITVASGKEASSTDINLFAAPAVTISGTATSSDGTPLSGTSVSINQNMIGPNSSSFRSIGGAPIGADGSWRIKNIPPGEYELSASTQQRDRPAESARISLLVQGGADVEGIALVADAGTTISGVVTTDDAQALPTTPARLRVVADPVNPIGGGLQIVMGDDNGLVSSDGRFAFKAASGAAVIKIWGLPAGWAIKSIESGDADYIETPVPMSSARKLDTVKITITNRFPVLSGRVTDERGQPADGTVLLFSEDDKKWIGMADTVRPARVDPSGVFRYNTVRPGDYLVVALESAQQSQVADPEFLAELRDKATRVTVREGENAALVLKVVK